MTEQILNLGILFSSFQLYCLHPLPYFLTLFSLSHGWVLLPLKMIKKATFSEGVCPPAGLRTANACKNPPFR